MPSEFETIIEQFSFDKNGINKLRSDSKHYEDWPVVYILNGDKEAYVGETQSAYDRMNQHYINKDTTRKNLTRINIVQSDSFNKSHEYKECDEAIERIKKRIDIVKILELIDDVSCIDDDYKQFLKILINKRCEVFLGI